MVVDIVRLEDMARQIRRDVVRMIAGVGAGHPGGALGAAEIFAALYGGALNLRLDRLDDPDRDRVVLSNGHICAAWYSVMSLAGLIPREELAGFRRLGSRLQGHPARRHLPELVETSSGPLGQSVPVANGIALGLRMQGSRSRVYCLVGDGEMQEGIVWEALMSASHRRLDSMTLVVLANNIQIDGEVSSIKKLEPLCDRLDSFGWAVQEIDGHRVGMVIDAFVAAAAGKEKPQAIVARTVLGKGVSFMENRAAWHGAAPTRQQAVQALEEIGRSASFTDYPETGSRA
jgi:transketolase